MGMGTKKGAPDDVPSIDSSLCIICPSFHGACGLVWGSSRRRLNLEGASLRFSQAAAGNGMEFLAVRPALLGG